MKAVRPAGRKINLIFILLFSALAACSPAQDESTSASGFYFNTVIQITVYDPVQKQLLDDCFALASRYENLFSSTIPDSDISRINAAGGQPVTVDEETAELLSAGITYGDLSGGKFDITIGRLSGLWDISTRSLLEETDSSMVPSDPEIRDALATVDYRNIRIEGNEVTLLNPDASIDAGGLAKGYIADKMKAFLNENGVTRGFINLGGNVLVLGPKAGGKGTDGDNRYTIGIRKPFAPDGAPVAAVKVMDETVVSSGVYERCFEVDGVLYHHILDTATGRPYDNGLLGVTVITEHSLDGDALSTICFSLGLTEGMDLIERTSGAEAVFITDDGRLHKSSGIGSQIPFTDAV